MDIQATFLPFVRAMQQHTASSQAAAASLLDATAALQQAVASVVADDAAVMPAMRQLAGIVTDMVGQATTARDATLIAALVMTVTGGTASDDAGHVWQDARSSCLWRATRRGCGTTFASRWGAMSAADRDACRARMRHACGMPPAALLELPRTAPRTRSQYVITPDVARRLLRALRSGSVDPACDELPMLRRLMALAADTAEQGSLCLGAS